MKLAFSTLGCPDWSWEDMIVTAKDLGFDGIEVRGIENELHVPNARPFLPENIESTKARLEKMNLKIPCLTSSCYLYDKCGISNHMNEGRQYIDLAHTLGVPYVRVLGDRNPEPGEGIDTGFVTENLSALGDYAQGKGVKVLIETNGIFADSLEVRRCVERTGLKNVGILWDIHHPFRYMNEPAAETYNNLKDYIKHVHIKDSKIENEKVRYKMMGYGDVPVAEVLELLKKDNYEGYVTLEWVKRWCSDLEDPGVVFSHYINFVKDHC